MQDSLDRDSIFLRFETVIDDMTTYPGTISILKQIGTISAGLRKIADSFYCPIQQLLVCSKLLFTPPLKEKKQYV